MKGINLRNVFVIYKLSCDYLPFPCHRHVCFKLSSQNVWAIFTISLFRFTSIVPY